MHTIVPRIGASLYSSDACGLLSSLITCDEKKYIKEYYSNHNEALQNWLGQEPVRVLVVNSRFIGPRGF